MRHAFAVTFESRNMSLTVIEQKVYRLEDL